ncbi:MAG: hypothetical protein MK066_14590, partial [Crocinitomicaceae bacterium]|nr:hypothetical protein [Crocinitomicaceae bacterium]
MKHIKIVDTIATFGNAEKYISYEAKFEQFMNREFGLTRIKELDPLAIVKKYNLKGIVFGNYVSQEERYFFLFKIEKQLSLLASLKGSNNLGKGILIIAFGSQGMAKA